MSKRSGWDHNLSVTARGNGLVGHAGAVLLRKCADRVGLTTALSSTLPLGQGPGSWDRGQVLVNLAVAIVLGGTGMSDIALLAHHASVFGQPPSDSTVGRSLAALDDRLLRRVAASAPGYARTCGTCSPCARTGSPGSAWPASCSPAGS